MTLNEGPDSDSPKPPLVLVAVEDDSFTALVDYILTSLGFSVLTASSGNALTGYLKDQTPDVLLVESRLPGVEVSALCARLRLERRTRAIAIIVLAADGDERNQREMLESGADEYLIKPFSPEKLVISLQAVLHETNRMPELSTGQFLTFLDLELDLTSYRVRRGGRIVHLAPTEFRLLHHLMKNPNRVYSRDELQHAAWPQTINLGPRTVDVHIGRLRAALNEANDRDLIRTVRSVGYALSD